MKKINKYSKKYRLKIIEDKAHVFDLKRAQNKITYASYYSLDHSKIINTHLGGVATLIIIRFIKNTHTNTHNTHTRLGK